MCCKCVLYGHSDCRYVIYVLDHKRGNPYASWLEAGSPATPSVDQLRDMRRHEVCQYLWFVHAGVHVCFSNSHKQIRTSCSFHLCTFLNIFTWTLCLCYIRFVGASSTESTSQVPS